MQHRFAFVTTVFALTGLAVYSFVHVLSGDGLSALDLFLVAVFVPLAVWLAQSFCTLSAGALVIAWGRLVRPASPPAGSGLEPELPRVAVALPCYNEEAHRVFAGIAAMRDELADLGVAERVDVFVLSDTTDPDLWLEEEEAWDGERHRRPGAPRLFYRRRFRNLRRKTGNIAQFIERFGGAYGYMVVLDADSLMSGEAIWALIRRLDREPDTALIQAPPKLVRGETPFARLLEFAGDVYGPLGSAGIAFWAGGEGNYWGHNAIIRLEAFATCCGLPDLPGRAPLGGEILSHDFVEAALLRRAGWHVRMAWDLGGSFEESPPTLEDYVVRDRRWAQGNLQHALVMPARGLHWVSRLHLLIGIMSYLTSPLWLVFLVLSGLQAWSLSNTPFLYFEDGLPRWPISREDEAGLLLAGTLGMLFLPKFWGLFLALADGTGRRARGGAGRLVGGFVLENVMSALIAPIMMIRHTQFVVSILTGGRVEWKPQRRAAGQADWTAAWGAWRDVAVVGVAASAAVAWLAPALALWLSPVLAGLIGAPAVAVALGSPRLGRLLGCAGLFAIPEQGAPPSVLRRLRGHLATRPELTRSATETFAHVVIDPRANERHRALIETTGEAPTLSAEACRVAERKAVHLGFDHTTREDRRAVLESAEAMARLHAACWARRLDGSAGAGGL